MVALSNKQAERSQLLNARQLQDRLGAISPGQPVAGQSRQALLRGHFFARRLSPGLSVHCVDAVELADSRSTGECGAGISLNVLLEGRVSFCLGNKRYSGQADTAPQALALTLASGEPFTRLLQAGQRVAKVNVSASAQWLRERLGAAPTRPLLARGVTRWPADRALQGLARRLIALSHGEADYRVLLMEAAAVQMLFAALGDCPAEASPVVPTERATEDLSRQLLPHIQGSCDLTSLAKALGFSASTLQRRFKSQYGVTVMEYVRRQRLERARTALLVEGVSVQQAAFMAGYDHPSNFVSAFKRQFATTPAALVRLHLVQGIGTRETEQGTHRQR